MVLSPRQSSTVARPPSRTVPWSPLCELPCKITSSALVNELEEPVRNARPDVHAVWGITPHEVSYTAPFTTLVVLQSVDALKASGT